MHRLWRLFLLILCLPAGVHAQVQETELKAAVIFNFMQFTQWPDRPGAYSGINLCVSAENPIYEALLRAATKPVQGREVSIVPIVNAGIGDCHVVVMGGDDRRKAAQFQRLLVGPVLGISDDAGALPGEMIIVMGVERARIVFSVNNAKAVASGLSISSRLLRLARSVQ